MSGNCTRTKATPTVEPCLYSGLLLH